MKLLFHRRRRAVSTVVALSFRYAATVTTTNTVAAMTTSAVTTTTTTTTTTAVKIIDSHLHVWASTEEAQRHDGFPYAVGQEPPDSLKDVASVDSLLKSMNDSNVAGALIVQPINHKFDHRYVAQRALRQYPDRLKGMLLHDPSLSPEIAVSRLEDLALQGFVGVRFNPYLWPKSDERDGGSGGKLRNEPMSTPHGSGLAVYKRCAQLQMPVGVMCFQGLELHHDDIQALLEASPDTQLVLDHFAFTKLTKTGDAAFQRLLQLAAKYPQVSVKISALFRLDDTSPYERVRTERFEPLLKAFGADRLMFGTDFPFALEQEPERYNGMVKLVSSWLDDEGAATKAAVMGGTAERLFGPWGVGIPVPTGEKASSSSLSL